MADERETERDIDQEVLEDLDAGEDAERVMGGRAEDPCEGGEITKP